MQDQPHRNWALAAWIGLTAYVCVADYSLIRTQQDTMSTAFREAVHHPIKRWPVGVVWTIVTIHLFTHFKYDPISMIGRRIK